MLLDEKQITTIQFITILKLGENFILGLSINVASF